MSRTLGLGFTAALTLAIAVSASSAQQAPPAAAAAAAQPAIEPDAMVALERMGTALRGLQSFGLHVDGSTEEVLTTGQKIQHGGTVDYQAQRPNLLRIEMTSDRQARTIYYDGRSLTLFAPRIGYYASFAAPPTIGETLRTARDRFDLETPLADLFTWGTDAPQIASITSGFRVGTETIGGQRCEHFAFRQENVDWQVWIREGTEALPCKLVITSTDDPSMPQYTALLTWRPNATFAANSFTFTPPENARRIEFTQVGAGN